MAEQTVQPFNALSGPEVIKFLLTKIEKTLTESGEFSQNLTLPWFEYGFVLNVTMYPKQAKGSDPLTKIGTEGSEGEKPAPPETLTALTVEGGEVVDTPDLARIESGQPVTTPQVEHGVTVDKPRRPPLAKPLPWLKKDTLAPKAPEEVTNG